MSKTDTPPPLSDARLANLKIDANALLKFDEPVRRVFAQNFASEVLALLAELTAARAQIAAHEQAAEWRPTHRGRKSPSRVEVIDTSFGHVEYKMEQRRTQVLPLFKFKELYEPLPEIEGEKAPICP